MPTITIDNKALPRARNAGNRPGASLYETQTLNVIAANHSIVAAQPDIGNVWSLETLREWLAKKAHERSVAVLKRYVDMLPNYLT